MFTQKQMESLLEAQNELNIKYLGENWRDQISGSSIITAVFTETAEYLESAPRVSDKEQKAEGWKWWKKVDINDEQNMAIEAIDVLHFILTYYLQLFPNKTYAEMASAYNDNVRYQFDGNGADEVHDTQQRITNILKSFAGFILNHYSRYMIVGKGEANFDAIDAAPFILLENLYVEAGKSSDDIYNGYFKKNALNHKRVENGYSEGKYDKIDEDGNEDNRKLDV